MVPPLGRPRGRSLRQLTVVTELGGTVDARPQPALTFFIPSRTPTYRRMSPQLGKVCPSWLTKSPRQAQRFRLLGDCSCGQVDNYHLPSWQGKQGSPWLDLERTMVCKAPGFPGHPHLLLMNSQGKGALAGIRPENPATLGTSYWTKTCLHHLQLWFNLNICLSCHKTELK